MSCCEQLSVTHLQDHLLHRWSKHVFLHLHRLEVHPDLKETRCHLSALPNDDHELTIPPHPPTPPEAPDLLRHFVHKLSGDAGAQEELRLHVSLLFLLFHLRCSAGGGHGDDVDDLVRCLVWLGLEQRLHLLQPQHQLLAAAEGRRTLWGHIHTCLRDRCICISLRDWGGGM